MSLVDKYLKENIEENEILSFIDDSRKADEIFKDLEIAANDMIMNTIIPKMKKIQDSIEKKHQIKKNARMAVDYMGTAYIHDVFRQLLGQNILSVSSGLKRIGVPKRKK